MTLPLLSVIVPTYKREQPLCLAIQDLLQQNHPSFEIIVVDQTPCHQVETQSFLHQLATVGKIRWFRVDWASLPAARNYGLQQAKGDIVVFVDDDVKIPPDFLSAHAAAYQNSPKIAVIAGRVLDRAKQVKGKTIDMLPPEAMDPAIAWYYLDLVHTTTPQSVLTARGCNMSFRSDVLRQNHIYFDERYGGSAIREESDVCLRLRQLGYDIWYAPDAVLTHLGEETGGCHTDSFKSLKYQAFFYHNHFWLAFKNLTWPQTWHTFSSLFRCQVLPNTFPYYKRGGLHRILLRTGFYGLGLFWAIATVLQSPWQDGLHHNRPDGPSFETTHV